jgi:hypothetical protein
MKIIRVEISTVLKNPSENFLQKLKEKLFQELSSLKEILLTLD